ncbi:MAG: tRNA (adenosine(37)-N6)-dimethylallyltransferase MiaA, partial [Patescibacteria group bacterium]
MGPTASGKSDIAVALAKKLNGEVISADSRQVYKGLDIGAGKITKKEMRGVPHHLLDVANPRKQFTVADYKTLTNLAIAQIVKVGKVPIICGGTGFYISALLDEINIPEVKPNETLRKQLAKKSASELFEILKKLDPIRVKNIDPKNPRRLIRAIEIARKLGRAPSLEARNPKFEIRNKFQILKIGIKLEKEKLRERIKKKIDMWIKRGLIKEVKNLHKKGLSWRRMSEIGLEYRIVADFLRTPPQPSPKGRENQMTILKKKLEEKTWQYAKRQLTWFKRDKSIKWFGPNIKKITKEVE